MRFKLSLSILKNNKLFSSALILIYTLVTSLLVMLCFFSQSIDLTFNNFLETYNLPDGYVITSLNSKEVFEELNNEEKVEIVYGLVLDLNTTLENGTTYCLRYVSMNEDSKLKLYNVDLGSDVIYNEDLVAVSKDFAKSNDLKVGDKILVNNQELYLSDIVSSPETISSDRDSLSWYDGDSFGYIYISEELMNEVTKINGFYNQLQLYIDDSLDKQEVLDKITNNSLIDVQSSFLFENSLVDKQIKAGIEGTKAVVTYLPAVIILIGLLFSTLFISQIIQNSQKKIALLKVLGYSNLQVSFVFVFYSLFLSLVSASLGLGFGYIFLKMMLKIYQNVYYLPQIVITGDYKTLFIIILIIQILGIVSCLLCCNGISKTDPMLIGINNNVADKQLPKILKKLVRNPFDEIGLINISRHYKRLIMSILCSIACFTLSFAGLALLSAKSKGIDSLFNDRLNFDLTIYGSQEALEIISGFDEIACSKQITAFSIEYEDETMRIETYCDGDSLINVYDTQLQKLQCQDGQIAIEEGFARRHNLKVNDTIIINSESFTVSCLLREYLYPMMYISVNDGSKLGYENNALNVILKDKDSITELSNKLCEVEGYKYFTNNIQRENNARSMLDQLNTPCLFFIIFAMVIGLTIVVNMNLLSIKERKREYATFLILGVDFHYFLKMSFFEAFVQFFFTCLFAIPISIPLCKFLFLKMSSSSLEYVLENPLIISVYTTLLILVYIVVSVLMTNVYIRKMDILKSLGDRQ